MIPLDSDPPFTEQSKVKVPLSVFVGVMVAVAGAAGTWAATWISLKSDVVSQGRDLQALRSSTAEQISDIRREQNIQHDILLRVDQNVRVLRNP